MARLKRLEALLVLLALAACNSAASAGRPVIRIGALYPTTGSLHHYGTAELRGAEIAVDLFNDRGGLHGRKVALDVANAPDVDAGWRNAYALARRGVPAIVGTYSSTISLAA